MKNVYAGEQSPDAATDTGPAQREGRTAQAALLIAGSCMPVLGAVLLAPVLPTLTAAFRGTPYVEILVPLVLTVPALFVALFSPVAGWVADRVGRKKLLIAAMIVYALFGTAPLYLTTLQGIVASRVGVGIAEAAIITCCTTLITDYYSGTRRNKYLGLQTMVSALAATAFFAIGGALGSVGWRAPFWMYAISAVIVIPMILVLWEPARSGEKAQRTPVPWRQVAVPSLVTLFGGIVFYTLIVHLPYVVTGLGVADPAVIGIAAAVASLATAAGAVSFRYLARLGTPRQLALAFGLAGTGLLVVASATAVPVAIAGAVIAGAGTGLLLPTLLTWAVSNLQLEQRGRGTGIWTSTLFIGQFLTPIVVIAISALGDLNLALGTIGVLSLVALAGSLVAVTRARKPVSV